MSILIDENTRAIVQGITGNEGRFHTRRMLDYGTKIVGGVTPGKGGSEVEGVPVFDTVAEAVGETGANASIIFVPPAFAADAIMEAAEAGVELVVCLTEGIPVNDILLTRRYLDVHGTTLIGPNTPGLISPGKCKLGVMAGYIHKPGPVGILSRSGTLTYEVQIIGLSFADLLPMFEDDTETEGIVLIGEIGGTAEEEAAEVISERVKKPLVAFIAGRTAPPGRRMGHAGAIVTGRSGTAETKIAALREAGVSVADSPADVGELMAGRLTS